jgi:6-phosphogluconolactonase
MTVEHHSDAGSLAMRAAELFMSSMVTSVRTQGRFTVALSGGGTPRATYEGLARRAGRDEAPWANVHVFWGDERCVPVDDERSNERMARAALLSHVPIPEAQIHPMRCARDSVAATSRYEELLRAHFGARPRFDLVLLGLGEDGHTASLFPRSALLTLTKDWVGFERRSGEEFGRLTLTLPAINQAARVVFLVSGARKAEALRRALSGDRDIPAGRVQPDGELRWLVDASAARLLGRAR